MKEYKYYSRKFLNKKRGIANIECDVETTTYSMYASAKISDCNRAITLDFTAYSAKELDEKNTKIELLIQELIKLQQFIADHKDVWFEELRKQDLKRLATKKKQPLGIDIETVAG